MQYTEEYWNTTLSSGSLPHLPPPSLQWENYSYPCPARIRLFFLKTNKILATLKLYWVRYYNKYSWKHQKFWQVNSLKCLKFALRLYLWEDLETFQNLKCFLNDWKVTHKSTWHTLQGTNNFRSTISISWTKVSICDNRDHSGQWHRTDTLPILE